MRFLSPAFWTRFPAGRLGVSRATVAAQTFAPGRLPQTLSCGFLSPLFPTAEPWPLGAGLRRGCARPPRGRGPLGPAGGGPMRDHRPWEDGVRRLFPRRGRLGRGRAARVVSPKGGTAVGSGWCHNTPCPEAEPEVSLQTGRMRTSPASFPPAVRPRRVPGLQARSTPGHPGTAAWGTSRPKPRLGPGTWEGRDHRIAPKGPTASCALLPPGCSAATSPWGAALRKAPK